VQVIVKYWDFANLGWMNIPATVEGGCEITVPGYHVPGKGV